MMARAEFPQSIKTTKLERGYYRITREDGYSIEVRSSVRGDWYKVGNVTCRQRSLRMFKYDMAQGFTSHDYLKEALA